MNPDNPNANSQESQPAPAESAVPDDKQIALELQKRGGVLPEEIQRLVAQGQPSAPNTTAQANAAPLTPAVPLEPEYQPHPTIQLPEPRESSAAEKEGADKALLEARLLSKRNQYNAALEKARNAVELTPGDAEALEVYGDILQSLGRVDDALFAYSSARELNPSLTSADKKYAELLLLQTPISSDLLDEVPRSARLAVMMSTFLPGWGQIYNHEPVKGWILIAVSVVCWLLLISQFVPLSMNPLFIGVSSVLVVTLIYAVVDANLGASRHHHRSGWDV
ncbi:MAG: hypothetical protein M1330_01460 [Armatimonadetes bacterium]|nr:hypothetical protein [Armatimonadota bacterium]